MSVQEFIAKKKLLDEAWRFSRMLHNYFKLLLLTVLKKTIAIVFYSQRSSQLKKFD
ncbi:unnamed protein product [Paramecium sonneborni]|uniref:Uncharacterized protein n=1 Tax=Paramecium sonneborni TaxID=65129 RepID=A0A8S1RR68_9CILI|nr:unnamed protein product [Paramecium sonneborni]